MDDIRGTSQIDTTPDDFDDWPVVGVALDEAEEARLDAIAIAEFEAGQFVTHERVVEWLLSRGTDHELPCPEPEPH